MTFSTLLPYINILSTILIGFIVGRVLNKPSSVYSLLNKTSVYFSFPILIFQSLLKSPVNYSNSFGPIITFSLIALTIYITGIFVKVKTENREKGNAWFICLNFGNIAFIGLPLITGLYPTVTYTPLFIALTLIIVFGCVTPIIQSKGNIFQNLMIPLTSPLFIASALGLIFNLLSLDIPDIAHKIISPISFSATYIALIAIGVFISTQDLRYLFNRESIKLSLVKILMIPTTLIILNPIFHCDILIFKSMVLFFGLPIAITPFSMTSNNPIEQSLTGNSIIVSTILSMISLPIFFIVMELLF